MYIENYDPRCRDWYIQTMEEYSNTKINSKTNNTKNRQLILLAQIILCLMYYLICFYFAENVIFTKPYKDATSGAISMTSTVMINDAITKAPIVIAIDFLITNFVTKILIDKQSPNPDTYTVLFHQDNNTVKSNQTFLKELTNQTYII